MIEIGRRSTASWATRRAAEALGGMAAILILVWLVRGILGIQQYSGYLLLASFGLIFLGRLFSTEGSAGVGRAVSSFLWNIAASAIIIIILVWFLGWVASIQSDVFPSSISAQVPNLVIAAIATGLAAYAAHKFSPNRPKTAPAEPAFLVGEGSGPSVEGVRVTAKRDTVSLPIRKKERVVGCVLLGDVSASFETPMGQVTATLAGPVTTLGVPFRGNQVGKDEAVRLTGKTPRQLVEQTPIDTSAWERSTHSEDVDFPLVHVRTDPLGHDVELGPIKFRQGADGEQVKIGPARFESDEAHEAGESWFAKGLGGSYVRLIGGRVSAKWNGSSLSLSGASMTLAVGSDSFSYSPTEVMTSSPLHSLKVNQDKITLDTRKFSLKVHGDRVTLRTEDKTTSTESKALAGDLRTFLTETAKKQVRDMMEEAPIDLSEMLGGTEEVLARHG